MNNLLPGAWFIIFFAFSMIIFAMNFVDPIAVSWRDFFLGAFVGFVMMVSFVAFFGGFVAFAVWMSS